MTFETVKEQLVNGDICPIETYFYFRNAYNIFESLKKDKDCIAILINAFQKYGKKDKPVYNGTTIQFSTRKAVTFDSNDPYLLDLELKRDKLTGQIASRKAFLKSLEGNFADESTEGLILEAANVETEIVISFKKA
jgi:hypothetical protein